MNAIKKSPPVAPANPTGSKIILHRRRVADLTQIMLLMRCSVSIFSRALNGSIVEPNVKKSTK